MNRQRSCLIKKRKEKLQQNQKKVDETAVFTQKNHKLLIWIIRKLSQNECLMSEKEKLKSKMNLWPSYELFFFCRTETWLKKNPFHRVKTDWLIRAAAVSWHPVDKHIWFTGLEPSFNTKKAKRKKMFSANFYFKCMDRILCQPFLIILFKYFFFSFFT